MRVGSLIVAALAACSATVAAQDAPVVVSQVVLKKAVPVTLSASDSAPVPITDPGTWVTTDDYPAWAVQHEVDGRVRFSVDVDADGRVTNCEVLETSGVPDLDEVACAKISERARFRPARDERGNPVAGQWKSAVRWQLPADGAAVMPPPGALVLSMVIEPDGLVSSCQVELADGAADVSEADVCGDQGYFAPILDAAGNPQRTRVRTTMRIEHEAVSE